MNQTAYRAVANGSKAAITASALAAAAMSDVERGISFLVIT